MINNDPIRIKVFAGYKEAIDFRKIRDEKAFDKWAEELKKKIYQ